MSLGQRIKEQRKRSGLSQEKVSELVGVSRQAVTKWESGASAPSTENLFRLADILGTTVDMLIAPEEKATDSLAEQIYHLYKADEEKKTNEKKARIKKNVFFFFSIIFGYLLIYLLGRIFARTGEPVSGLYWLIGNDPGRFSYLYGWLLTSDMFWIAMAVSALPALFGKKYFSLTALLGFVAGLLLGEACGKNPSGAALGFGHYGWAIWGCIFVFSMAMGAFLQKLSKNGLDIKSKKLHIWAVIAVFGITAIVLLIRMSMPTFA